MTGHPNDPASLSILVVDDNPDSAQTLSWMLELFGHDVRSAHDGATALRLATEMTPRVVLLDIGLPGMDGYELCRRMRALPALRDTVFAAQTGWDNPDHRRLSREAGFAHHLIKPVALETLRELLATVGSAQAAAPSATRAGI